jgi:hypothetical protein
MDNVMEAYWQAPPIARTLATIVLGTSLAVTLKLLPAQLIIFHPYYIWKFPPEIWRIPTSFLLTGEGLGLLFDTYFLYQYLSQLELGNPRFPRKEDLIWYLMFVSGTTLVSLAISSYSVSFFQIFLSTICICPLIFFLVCVLPVPHHICPDSALPLQLSRFLEMRKITPASQADPTFAYPRAVCSVGMVGCLMDGSCDHLFA